VNNTTSAITSIENRLGSAAMARSPTARHQTRNPSRIPERNDGRCAPPDTAAARVVADVSAAKAACEMRPLCEATSRTPSTVHNTNTVTSATMSAVPLTASQSVTATSRFSRTACSCASAGVGPAEGAATNCGSTASGPVTPATITV